MILSSVILCTRNRLTDVLSFLQSLAEQTESAHEIIIVDSSDQPIKDDSLFQNIFNKRYFPKTHLIYKHTSPGLPYQRNVGIALATGEIIYFFDDDTILEPNYLQEMNLIFDQYPEYAGGMGDIINLPRRTVLRRIRSLFQRLFLLHRNYAAGNFTLSGMPTHAYGTHRLKKVEVLGGCCMAFRACALKKQQFDESLNGYAFMEDCDISRRVSYDAPLFYNPKARLHHLESPLARDRVIDNRAMYIRNYSYLFFKNFYPRNKFKIIFYWWSIIGLFLEALLLLRIDYLKGYCKGLRHYYFSSRRKKIFAP